MEQLSSSIPRRRVGIMGGTFDPIHLAHLIIAEEVRASLSLSEVVFVPTGDPPHKLARAITEAYHRVAMVQLAIASNPLFSLSRVEVDRSGPSYSADTLRILHEQWGTNTDLFFVIGWDSLEDLHSWYHPADILTQIAHLVAVRRPGYAEKTAPTTQVEAAFQARLEERLPGIMQRLIVVPAPQLDISSTEIRRRVSQGRTIKYQTSDAVELYILEHSLYR